MKILFVVEQYTDEGSRYYREFFRHLKGMGASVVVVNLNQSSSFRNDVSEFVDGFHSLGLSGGYHRCIPALRGLLRRESPSVVQGMEIIPTFYAALALTTILRGRPVLVYGRRHGPTEGAVARLMDWVAFRAARRVIAVSGAMADVARAEHPLARGKVTSIRSGVSLMPVPGPPKEGSGVLDALRADGAFKALLLARIRPGKGHGVALRAAEILKARGKPIRLLFVGEGGGRKDMENEVGIRGLTEDVVFTGHMEDIRGILELADAMLIPSSADAFPKVAVEAFAAGLPVVASGVGGLKELIVHGETGLTVEPGDPEGLADALADLMENPEKGRRLAANALGVYRKELTPQVMVERYFQEYQRLVGVG